MNWRSSWGADGLALYQWGEAGMGGAAPWQRAFHGDNARLRALIAANQVGKSRAGAAETWWHATGTHPQRPIARHEGLGWICVATWGRPYQQVVRNLMATCPRDLVDWGKTTHVPDDDRFVNNQIVMKDGFTIRFVPTGGGSTNAAAGTVDWLWIDEPPARAKWGELLMRPSRWQGPIWLTCTPWDSTQDLTWLRTELEGDAEKGTPPAAPWQIHRARKLPSYVPWMAPEAVMADRLLVPEAESAIRNDGEWEGAIQGRFFTTYGPPFDQLPKVEAPGAPWQLVGGLDYGEGAGKTAGPITAQRRRADGMPEIRALTEYVSDHASTVQDDAAGVRTALGGIKLTVRDVSRWVGDTNTLGKASPGARVNQAMARALGVPHIQDADKRPGAPDTGWRLLAQAMGMGLIHVDAARCPRLDRALKRWRGLDDDSKHILDGFRYATYDLLLDTLGSAPGTQGGRIY